ncbi:MAG: hypothetical protein ACKOEL_01015 [Planctomycetota bacterium]
MSASWRRTRSQRAKRQGRWQSRGSVVAARGDEFVEGRDLDLGGGRAGKREQQLAGGTGQFTVRGAGIVRAGGIVRRLTSVPLAMAVVIARAVEVPVALVPVALVSRALVSRALVSMAASSVGREQATRVGRVVAQVQRSQPTAARRDERRRAKHEDGMQESVHWTTL